MQQKMKKWRGYFTFSKRERNVGLYLVTIIFVITVLPAFSDFFPDKQIQVNQQIIAQLEFPETVSVDTNYFSSENKYHSKAKFWDNKFEKNTAQNNAPTAPIQYFPFNPNTISKQQWVDLGIAPYVADRLVNYVAKGGKFYQKNDLLKTYGFEQKDLDRLSDFIVLDSIKSEQKFVESTAITIPLNRQTTEINTATKEQLMALGFSADNAVRIIKFRTEAGGIYDVEQLSSVFGINMDVLLANADFLWVDVQTVKKININTAAAETLAAHVYISDEMAKAIVDYRSTTGKFYSITELRKVPGMYAALFEKLKPYLIL